MPRLLIALVILVYSILPSCAADLNSAAHISGLVHCERAKREKKFLWLKPGKVKFYHYEWVMPDGSTVVKVEDAKRPGVFDRRPFPEAHPNLAIIIPTAQAAGVFVGPIVSSFIRGI